MIFDVNETLIDFQSLNPLFKKTFGDEKVLREWLGHLILYSMTLTMSGLYKDYWDIGRCGAPLATRPLACNRRSSRDPATRYSLLTVCLSRTSSPKTP
jgi:hypothetical protein